MHLVLGSSLRALKSAENQNSVIYLTLDPPPHFFEEEYQEWNEKVLHLSLVGKLRTYQKIKKIDLHSDHASVLFSDNGRQKIHFSSCEVHNTGGVRIHCSELLASVRRYLVYDWMVAESLCAAPDHPRMAFERDFCQGIYFYEKNKILCKSRLTYEQLQDINYSDVYSRFTTIRELREAGMTGRKNGKSSSGKQKYLGIDLRTTKRDVLLEVRDSYRDVENVRFF